MKYTNKQKEYIDSVEGEAHQSAVGIIGQLEKANKMKDTIITLIIAGMAVVIIAQHCAIKAPSLPVSVQTIAEIPSIRQIQQMLKDTGKKRYDPGPIDNIPGPRFMTTLEKYKCDEFAIKEFE